MSAATRFFGSAAGFTVLFAALVPVLFPFRALGLDPAVEREPVWLLTVFCTGVMMALFGTSALLGGLRFVGMREVLDAGGVRAALDRRDRERARAATDDGGGFRGNFAHWCVATGGMLVGAYFILWLAL